MEKEKENKLQVQQYDTSEVEAKRKKILKKVAAGVGTAALVTTLGGLGCVVRQQQESVEIPVVPEFPEIEWVIMGGPAAWFDSDPIPIPPFEFAEDFIFPVVEEMPSFPEGDEAMRKFIRENMQYPAVARELHIQGRVTLQFVVEKDGSLTDIIVVRGVDPALDREAIRLVESMPKWIPGKQQGKEVRVQFILPITFRLDEVEQNSY